MVSSARYSPCHGLMAPPLFLQAILNIMRTLFLMQAILNIMLTLFLMQAILNIMRTLFLMQAILNIMRTLFLMAIFCLGAYWLHKDSRKLVLEPIERIMHRVQVRRGEGGPQGAGVCVCVCVCGGGASCTWCM